jgi:endonuclease/exonuclease/phosphatase family metal-dependent hydrolase
MRALTASNRQIQGRLHPESPVSTNADDLVVISANLWHDWPRHRYLPDRLEAFADLVQESGAQVVLLQEVLRTTDFQADRWLADRLGMAYAYARANGHAGTIGFEEGSAVLSAFPLLNVQQITLQPSSSRFVSRIALGAQLSLPCCELWAFSTHLSLMRSHNRPQVQALQRWIGQICRGSSALIGGDFNAGEKSAGIQQARKEWVDTYRSIHPEGEAPTHSLRWPWGGLIHRERLDYVFLQRRDPGWQVLETHHIQTVERPYSDHDAVVTRLRYRPSSS